MKWTNAFIPTLREAPADAEILSHKLLLRAGLIRKLAGGVYTFLPLGLRALRKVEQIVREEMDRAGALEMLMPALQPPEIWQQSGRYETAGNVLFKLKDSGNREWVLSPTAEEVITTTAASEINSYRQLPKNFYQISVKFRDEIRPRFGLMRAREFIMKDAYSFDADDAGATRSYRAMEAAYTKFFARCGLKTISVEADTGVMGGSFSHEFMVPAEVGDDDVVFCEECGYAANRQKAVSGLVPADLKDAAPTGAVEEFPTPGIVTIAALEAAPYSVPADQQFKTLLYVGDGKLFAVVLRGCDDLAEAKLGALGFNLFRPATPEEIIPIMGARPGSLGVVRGTIKNPGALAGIFADHAVRLIGNGVTGANRDGQHLRNVNVARDLAITKFDDFRSVREGEPCPKTGRPLRICRAIEVGHVFKLGTKYSEKFGAVYTDDQKQSRFMIMGCYGIGISRTLQAVIEQCHDADGIAWPWNVAPFQVLVVLLDPMVPAAAEVARKLAAAAEAAGADVLLDDRNERPGVKFKDADLIGVPLRITVGGRGLKEGIVEMKWRTEKDVAKVPLAEAEARVRAAVAGAPAR